MIAFLCSLALLLALDASAARASVAGPTVGFYFWRDPPVEPVFADAWPGSQLSSSDYLPLVEWSPVRTAPRMIDVTLDAGPRAGVWSSGSRMRLRLDLTIKVARMPVDPVTGWSEVATVARTPGWRHILTKTIVIKGFEPGERIHLVSALALGQILQELRLRDEWPMELRAEVTIARPGKDAAPPSLQGTVAILPGG